MARVCSIFPLSILSHVFHMSWCSKIELPVLYHRLVVPTLVLNVSELI